MKHLALVPFREVVYYQEKGLSLTSSEGFSCGVLASYQCDDKMRKLKRGGIMSLQEGRIRGRYLSLLDCSHWYQSDSEFGLACQTVALYILFVFYLPPSVSFSQTKSWVRHVFQELGQNLGMLLCTPSATLF